MTTKDFDEFEKRKKHLEEIQELINELTENKSMISGIVIGYEIEELDGTTDTRFRWEGGYNKCLGISVNMTTDIKLQGKRYIT